MRIKILIFLLNLFPFIISLICYADDAHTLTQPFSYTSQPPGTILDSGYFPYIDKDMIATTINPELCESGTTPCAMAAVRSTAYTPNAACMIRNIDMKNVYWEQSSSTKWLLHINADELYGGGCNRQSIGVSWTVFCSPKTCKM